MAGGDRFNIDLETIARTLGDTIQTALDEHVDNVRISLTPKPEPVPSEFREGRRATVTRSDRDRTVQRGTFQRPPESSTWRDSTEYWKFVPDPNEPKADLAGGISSERYWLEHIVEWDTPVYNTFPVGSRWRSYNYKEGVLGYEFIVLEQLAAGEKSRITTASGLAVGRDLDCDRITQLVRWGYSDKWEFGYDCTDDNNVQNAIRVS